MQNLLIYVKKLFSNFIKLDFNYLKSKGVYVLTALISVFLMVYIAFQIKLASDGNIQIQVTENEKVTVYTELSGYIFMDEETIRYSEAGCVYIPHRDKIGKYVDMNEGVATLYRTDDPEKVEKIEVIDKKIALLKECMRVNEGVIGSKEYDRDVQNAYSAIISSARTGSLFGLKINTSLWIQAQGKKNIAVNYVVDYNKEINELEAERALIIESLGEGESINAHKNGKYFGACDGYEEYFSYEIAKKGGFEEFEEIFSGIGEFSATKKDSTLCGKMMYSTKWYFVAKIDPEELKSFRTGSVYMGEFEENNKKAMPLTFERSVAEGEVAYGVFSCSEMPSDFELIRFQNVKIKTAVYEGLALEMSAIRYVDGELGVYIAKSDKVHFRRIKLIGEYSGLYIIKPWEDFTDAEKEKAGDKEYLSRFDTVIVSGKELYHGKYIDMSELKD